ncbi:chemotaxis protein CheW [Alteriqipengyuania lutimaris]|uniref:Chemotaxis protein CheW n=1 Tax=Alteriqipengyuania lutimaris TaxID=1538146 RepID=A0A395LSE0_9SPHN|nr:chemotaxis protein CheW [Alteriqipengyuania lutimaris]MBB3032502.1 purine-binding chemotaxis protein CheW [Alteriqipengyuania lutimaris]RDS78364.1 chemotaxis protein CheW [Alteriqipengyuania lutimaris]
MTPNETADLTSITDAPVAANEAEYGEDTERKIVTFLLGKQTFGIDMSALIEIREWEDPTPLPSVPPYIKGVTNLRGHVVPVVGLAERLGWEPSVLHARSCILVVNIEGKHAGFLVDEVADIVSVADSAVQPAPEVEVTETSVIRGLVEIGQRSKESSDQKDLIMVSLLDLDKLSPTRHLDLAA